MKLINNSLYMLLGNIFFAFSQWFLLIAINKYGTPDQVGIFTYCFALSAPFFILAQGGLRSRIVIDQKREFNFNDYLFLRIILTILALIIISIYSFLYKQNIFISILYVSFFKIIDSIFDIYYGEYQRIEDMRNVALSKVYRGLFSVISFFATFIYTRDLNLSLLAYFISSLSVFFIFDFKNVDVKFKIDKFKIISLLYNAMPLAISAFLISAISSYPRIYIEDYISIQALGAFGSFLYLISAFSIILTSFCQAFSPRISKYYIDNNKNSLNKIIIILIFSSLSISVIFVLLTVSFDKYIFNIMFNKSFLIYLDDYKYLMYSSIIYFMTIPIGNILTATRKIKLQPYIFLISLIFIFIYGVFNENSTSLTIGVDMFLLSSIVMLVLSVIYLSSSFFKKFKYV